jgi:hypothetical protein
MMDKKEREALMDELLIFANDEIENAGCTIMTFAFDFTEGGEEFLKFVPDRDISVETLSAALNSCISRGYFKQRIMGAQSYRTLMLTEEGQGRAISADMAKHSPAPRQSSGNIQIGTLNAHGPAQIGNHNTQNIENVFISIVEQIEKSDAPEAEKQEIKSRLKAFLEHPLTGTLIGLAPEAIKALCGGG